MLFDRVIAKSQKEEITDEAILELNEEPDMHQDSDGSHKSNSPEKPNMA